MGIQLRAMFMCATLGLVGCTPPTGTTSFNASHVIMPYSGSGVARVSGDDIRLWSEDNISFSLQFLNCLFEIRPLDEGRLVMDATSAERIAADLDAGRPVLPSEKLQFLSQLMDAQIRNSAPELTLSTTFVGTLENPTPIRITDSWPVPNVGCGREYTAIAVMRRGIEPFESDGHESRQREVLVMRLLIGETAHLRRYLTSEGDVFLLALGAPEGIDIYDFQLREIAFTPGQQAAAGAAVNDVVIGILRAMSRR